MSLQTVRSPFAPSDYTPLAEHQEQTPDSFYDAKPVLHYHATGAKAWIPKSQRGKLPFFPADLASAPTAPESSALNDQTEETVEQTVDLFVNSRYDSSTLIPQPLSPHPLLTLPPSSGTSPSSAPPPNAASPFPTNKLAFTPSKPSVLAPTQPSPPSTSSSNSTLAAQATTTSTPSSSPSSRNHSALPPQAKSQRRRPSPRQPSSSRPSRSAPT